MKPRIHAEFTITGSNLDISEMTRVIGKAPSQTWRQGDRIQNTELRYKHDGWCLVTTEVEDLDMESLVRSLVELVIPHRDTLVELCRSKGFNAEVCCVAYVVQEQLPILCLDARIIDMIAQVGASLDIDVIFTAERSECSVS